MLGLIGLLKLPGPQVGVKYVTEWVEWAKVSVKFVGVCYSTYSSLEVSVNCVFECTVAQESLCNSELPSATMRYVKAWICIPFLANVKEQRIGCYVFPAFCTIHWCSRGLGGLTNFWTRLYMVLKYMIVVPLNDVGGKCWFQYSSCTGSWDKCSLYVWTYWGKCDNCCLSYGTNTPADTFSYPCRGKQKTEGKAETCTDWIITTQVNYSVSGSRCQDGYHVFPSSVSLNGVITCFYLCAPVTFVHFTCVYYVYEIVDSYLCFYFWSRRGFSEM